MSVEIVKEETVKSPMQVQDLKEGDIALIECHGEELLVVVGAGFESKAMISLTRTHAGRHPLWSYINNNTLPVIQVLEEGTLLRVTK